MNSPAVKIASIPIVYGNDAPKSILVIRVGEARFLTTRALSPDFPTPDSWLTYHPEEAHHWSSEEAARGCARDMAFIFRGQKVELIRLTRVRHEYRVQ